MLPLFARTSLNDHVMSISHNAGSLAKWRMGRDKTRTASNGQRAQKTSGFHNDRHFAKLLVMRSAGYMSASSFATLAIYTNYNLVFITGQRVSHDV